MNDATIWARCDLVHSPFADQGPADAPFLSGALNQARARLQSAIDQSSPLVVLSGEPGTGRTTVARYLAADPSLADRTVCLEADAIATFDDVLAGVAAKFAVDGNGRDDALLGRRVVQALRGAKHPRPAVLILDDADQIDRSVLEEVFRFLSVVAARRPDLTTVLIGEPDLWASIEQTLVGMLLSHRVTWVAVPPIAAGEVASYIAHRLDVAGYRGDALFAPDAIEWIATASAGIPARINGLCEGALVALAGTDARRVTARDLDRAHSATGAGSDEGEGYSVISGSPDARPARGVEAEDDARLERVAVRVEQLLSRPSLPPGDRPATDGKDAAEHRVMSAPAIREPVVSTPPGMSDIVTVQPLVDLEVRVLPAVTPGRSRRTAGMLSVLGLGIAAAIAVIVFGPPSERGPPPAEPPSADVTTPPGGAAGDVASAGVGAGAAAVIDAAPAGAAVPPEARDEATAATDAPPVAQEGTAPPVAVPIEDAQTAQAGPEPPPAAAQPATPAAPPAQPALDTQALLEQGDGFFRRADLASARLFYRLAVRQGSAAAASALALTYDPVMLRDQQVRGARPEPEQAMTWYRKAIELGDGAAQGRLDRLVAYLRVEAAAGDAEARRLLDSVK